MKKRVAMIGYGRLGQFLSRLLNSEYDLCVIDPEITQCDLPRIKDKDLKHIPIVIWCTPISIMRQSLIELAPYLNTDCTVIDTASVKIRPCQWMLETLPPSCECIATHPLFGPDSYPDCNTITMHSLRCSNETFNHWLQCFTKIGMTPKLMSPDDHDKELSITQGLTHYIGRSLEAVKLPDSDVATLGYTRLQQLREQTCNDSKQLFLDILNYNPYSTKVLEKIAERQQQILMSIKNQESKHGIK